MGGTKDRSEGETAGVSRRTTPPQLEGLKGGPSCGADNDMDGDRVSLTTPPQLEGLAGGLECGADDEGENIMMASRTTPPQLEVTMGGQVGGEEENTT